MRLLLLPVVIACCAVANAQGDGLKMSLSVRPSINITVATEGNLPGVTEDQIKGDVELLFRQSNIPILDKGADAGLVVYISATPFTFRGASIFAVLAEMDYVEPVAPDVAFVACAGDALEPKSFDKIFECTRSHMVMATLWRKNVVLQIGENRTQELRSTVKDFAQQFALEYLRASAKTR